MSATLTENRRFATEVVTPYDTLLDDAIEWIKGNLAPETVFDPDQLAQWALSEGWTYPEQGDAKNE